MKRFQEPHAVDGAGSPADADDEWGRHANPNERAEAEMSGRLLRNRLAPIGKIAIGETLSRRPVEMLMRSIRPAPTLYEFGLFRSQLDTFDNCETRKSRGHYCPAKLRSRAQAIGPLLRNCDASLVMFAMAVMAGPSRPIMFAISTYRRFQLS